MRKQLAYMSLIFMMCISISSEANAGYSTHEEQNAKAVQGQRANISKFYEKFKGKTFWIVPNPKAISRIAFANSPDQVADILGKDGWFHPDSITSFTVIEFESYLNHSGVTSLDEYFVKVRFEDGLEAYADAKVLFGPDSSEPLLNPKQTYSVSEYIYSRKPGSGSKTNPTASSNRAMKAGVTIGMSKAEVLNTSWGKPQSVNKTTTAHGTREQWVYGGRNYLYFENGILSAIQH